MREIDFDQLAQYSDWPARVMSGLPLPVRQKSDAEVTREYEREKWATLLTRVRALDTLTLADVERSFSDLDAEGPRMDGGRFFIGSARAILTRQLQHYERILAPYAVGASCFVELGAGFGSKVLSLADREPFRRLPIYAADFAPSARELVGLIARRTGRTVGVGRIDFRTLSLEGIDVPPGALVFTSYAVHYVPELAAEFVRFLAALRPSVVVHFEPCYEHHAADSVYGLMCRRYVESNDYTRNLVGRIAEAEREGVIAVRAIRNICGPNPFLPFSAIAWTPTGSAVARSWSGS